MHDLVVDCDQENGDKLVKAVLQNMAAATGCGVKSFVFIPRARGNITKVYFKEPTSPLKMLLMLFQDLQPFINPQRPDRYNNLAWHPLNPCRPPSLSPLSTRCVSPPNTLPPCLSHAATSAWSST